MAAFPSGCAEIHLGRGVTLRRGLRPGAHTRKTNFFQSPLDHVGGNQNAELGIPTRAQIASPPVNDAVRRRDRLFIDNADEIRIVRKTKLTWTSRRGPVDHVNFEWRRPTACRPHLRIAGPTVVIRRLCHLNQLGLANRVGIALTLGQFKWLIKDFNGRENCEDYFCHPTNLIPGRAPWKRDERLSVGGYSSARKLF